MTTTIKVTDSAGHIATQTIDLNLQTPATNRRLGVYMSGNNAGTDAYTNQYGVKTNHGSFYMNWVGGAPGTIAKAWAAKGASMQVVLATKYAVSGTTTYKLWTDIAQGKEDTRIISCIKAWDALGVPVYLALDCEPDAQYDATASAGGGPVGVAPGQTPAQYVAAANHVADLIHQNATNVESHVWIAGFKSAAISASFLPDASKLDNVGHDPYKTIAHSPSETFGQLTASFINNVLIPNGYTNTKRHITETGIQVEPGTGGSAGKQWTTQQQIDFWNSVPAGMQANNIESVVWFRANSGNHDYIPLDPAVDRAFATMSATLVG